MTRLNQLHIRNNKLTTWHIFVHPQLIQFHAKLSVNCLEMWGESFLQTSLAQPLCIRLHLKTETKLKTSQLR